MKISVRSAAIFCLFTAFLSAPMVGWARTEWKVKVYGELPVKLTDGPWTFVCGGRMADDILAIRRQAQPNVVVHELTAASGFQRETKFSSALHSVNEDWAFIGGSHGTLFAINRQGGSNTTEVHALHKDYRAFAYQSVTVLHKTNQDWVFEFGHLGNLYAINKQGVSSTEIHAIEQQGDYRSFKFQSKTALHKTDVNWVIGLRGDNDLVALNTKGRDGYVDVHVLDWLTDYWAAFEEHETMPFKADEGTWQFVIDPHRSNLRILAFKMSGIGVNDHPILTVYDFYRY